MIIDQLGPEADLQAIAAKLRDAMTPEVTAAIGRHLAEAGTRMTSGAVAHRRFGMVYKSFFLFVRVYQDAIYVVLNSLLGDRSPYGSMKSALKETNPVGAWLARAVPGYLEWFAVWRDQRNRWKEGADYHVAGPAPNLGIGFVLYNEATNGVTADLAGEIVRLPDATRALRQSCLTVEAAFDRVTGSVA
jgi:hypothetical protein